VVAQESSTELQGLSARCQKHGEKECLARVQRDLAEGCRHRSVGRGLTEDGGWGVKSGNGRRWGPQRAGAEAWLLALTEGFGSRTMGVSWGGSVP